jgi:hypothetical protein
MFISVRVGRVGVVAVLQDGGAQEAMRDELEQELSLAMHPLQHIEMGAMVSYKSLLATRTPKYVIAEEEPIRVIQSPLMGLSSGPLFHDWEQDRYAEILARITGYPLDQIFDGGTLVQTWFRKQDGSLNEIDFDTVPWPPPHDSEPTPA